MLGNCSSIIYNKKVQQQKTALSHCLHTSAEAELIDKQYLIIKLSNVIYLFSVERAANCGQEREGI
jgi:hypothetical protein